ncbi:MAG: hypothetical protein E7C36_06665, partial [Mixta calida]|nr:hypothetical protein [Mixta calida]
GSRFPAARSFLESEPLSLLPVIKSSFYTEFEQASLLNKAHQVTHHMPFSLPADNKRLSR